MTPIPASLATKVLATHAVNNDDAAGKVDGLLEQRPTWSAPILFRADSGEPVGLAFPNQPATLIAKLRYMLLNLGLPHRRRVGRYLGQAGVRAAKVVRSGVAPPGLSRSKRTIHRTRQGVSASPARDTVGCVREIPVTWIKNMSKGDGTKMQQRQTKRTGGNLSEPYFLGGCALRGVIGLALPWAC